MGQRLLLKSSLCFFLLIIGSQIPLWASSHLAIHSLDAFPSTADDTSTYHLELYVVNEDPTQSWGEAISVLMSVEGDEATALIPSFVPSSPVLPGDSVLISLNDYEFNPIRFSGGGITHDIIVWPSRVGISTIDSAETQIIFTHTQDESSHHIGLSCPLGFPPAIIDGQTYSLTFQVSNLDPLRNLIDPVSLYLSIDGDSGTVIAVDIAPTQPMAPGASFDIHVPNYLFDSGRFTGGGITHDIIVWPMTLAANQTDSFQMTVRHLTQAAFEMNISSAGDFTASIKPYQSYQLLLTTQNVGLQSSSTDLHFYLQLDEHPPVILGNKSGAVLPDYTTSLMLPNFRLATLYPRIVAQVGFARQSHTLRFWATESHIESWVKQSTLHIPANKKSIHQHTWGDLSLRALPIFPNPSSGQTKLILDLDHTTDIDMQLFDLSGRQVMQRHWPSKIGSTELEISLTDLPNGIYLYQLKTDTNRFQGRIVKE